MHSQGSLTDACHTIDRVNPHHPSTRSVGLKDVHKTGQLRLAAYETGNITGAASVSLPPPPPSGKLRVAAAGMEA